MTPDSLPSERHDMSRAFKLLRDQLDEICGVSVALCSQSNLSKLWRRIVRNAQIQLNVDGCTYYRIQADTLVYEVVLTRSLGLVSGATEGDAQRFPPIPLYDASGRPNTSSLAARVAIEGRTSNIANAERLPNYSASMTRAFDQSMGYSTRSMLTIPVRFRNEPVTGVLQLVNAKDSAGTVVEFDEQRELVANALAALIAIAGRLA